MGQIGVKYFVRRSFSLHRPSEMDKVLDPALTSHGVLESATAKGARLFRSGSESCSPSSGVASREGGAPHAHAFYPHIEKPRFHALLRAILYESS